MLSKLEELVERLRHCGAAEESSASAVLAEIGPAELAKLFEAEVDLNVTAYSLAVLGDLAPDETRKALGKLHIATLTSRSKKYRDTQSIAKVAQALYNLQPVVARAFLTSFLPSDLLDVIRHEPRTYSIAEILASFGRVDPHAGRQLLGALGFEWLRDSIDREENVTQSALLLESAYQCDPEIALQALRSSDRVRFVTRMERARDVTELSLTVATIGRFDPVEAISLVECIDSEFMERIIGWQRVFSPETWQSDCKTAADLVKRTSPDLALMIMEHAGLGLQAAENVFSYSPPFAEAPRLEQLERTPLTNRGIQPRGVQNLEQMVKGSEPASTTETVGMKRQQPQVIRILHISDLHRAATAPSSNTVLLGKLLDDIRYTYAEDNQRLGKDDPHLGQPDLIIVSGDLTQRADGKEFTLALRFLEGLLPLVDSDRGRVLIVPGNHDLNWKIAAQSYVAATVDEFKKQPIPGEPYRQSVKRAQDGTYWRKKETTYTARFRSFKAFFDAFYQGAYRYSLAREEMFTVYDHSELYGLIIAGYNSCDEIDAHPSSTGPASLDRRAFINTDAIHRAEQSPSFHAGQKGLIRIAVFHHNIRSVDHGEDFLDPKYLQIIKRHGFDLCLHGHVHSASRDIFDPLQAKMLPVVGAGSLAAPYTDRPPATPMGYNLLVINRETGGIWVHTRRHDENNLVWAPDYQWDGKPYFVVREPSNLTGKVAVNKQSPGNQSSTPAGIRKRAGIPADLHMRIRQALLDCGPFDDDRQLRAVFAHPLLSPWQNGVPQADNRAGRVDGIIDYLRSRKRSDTGENALVLLLKVLSERADPGDECHHRLTELAEEGE